jgi:predicted transcriptional regulator
MIKDPPPSAEQKEERRRLTLEALADVDAGRVVNHQAVKAWSDSLDTGRRSRTGREAERVRTNRLR